MAETFHRQFVNFIGYKVGRDWYGLEEEAKDAAREEFEKIIGMYRPPMMIRSYSTRGIRSEMDFFFWRISDSLETFDEMSSAMSHTVIGRYLSTAYSSLSMAKHLVYVNEADPGVPEVVRSRILPGSGKYILVHPLVRKREFYPMPKEDRQRIMDDYNRIVFRYKSVKFHTTYSFGLDDQDFLAVFESDKPSDLADLAAELRESKASLYTVRDTPVVTGIQKPLVEILAAL